MILSPALWIVLAACLVAVATDLRSRRVPNALTLSLAATALALHALQGWTSFAVALATMLVVLFVGFAAFSFGWLGGGDVKLLAAGAGALGFPDAVPFVIYTSIGGGILAVAVALAMGRLPSVLRSVGLMVRAHAVNGSAPVPEKPIKLPYAVAIAFGAVAVALSHTAAPFLRLPL
jgi:prepilin peptidase CpaA